MEGDPVIGCGALFISWGSAWGGRRVPVHKAGEKKKNKKKEKMLNVFAHTEYKTVTSSSTATMANVQFNVLVMSCH